MSDPLLSVPAITRVEVIDETGRRLVRHRESGFFVRLELLDGDKTAKIFISPIVISDKDVPALEEQLVELRAGIDELKKIL